LKGEVEQKVMASNLIGNASKQMGSSGFRKLFLGQCHPCQINKASRIVVKKMDFDEHLKMVGSFLFYFAFCSVLLCVKEMNLMRISY